MIDSRSEDANTAAALTSATPIISADALDDVRRGARATLSRASLPGVLKSLAIGHPIARVTGVAIVADTLAIPRKSSRAPPPAEHDQPERAARRHEQTDEQHDEADAPR